MVQVNYCLVKQNVGALIEDSPGDYDRYPDFKEVTGEVVFTPMIAAGQSFQLKGSDGEMYTVPITRIRGRIVEGKIWYEGEEGIPLFAGGEGANPSSVAYRVTYSNLRAGEDPVQLNPIAFTAIPGETIDLTTVTPISNAPVSGVIKGDKGDPFTFEDFTPEQREILRGDPFLYEDFTPQQLADLKGEKGDPGDLTSDQFIDTSFGTRLMLGDIMVYGDTGIVHIARWDESGNVVEGEMPYGTVPQESSPGFISLRRNMNVVTLEMAGLVIEDGISYMELGEGYRNESHITPFQVLPANVTATHSETGPKVGVDDAFLYGFGYMIYMVANSPGAAIPGMSNASAKATWYTADPWPTD